MRESGRVVAVENDALWVETIRQSTCNACSAEKVCGQGIMNRMGSGKRHHLKVPLDGRDPQDFQPNDEVTIRVPDGALVGAALLVYLVPLLGLIGGMLFFEARFAEPAIGALLGFGSGLGLVWLHGRLQFVGKRYQPVLVGRPRRSASGVQTIHI